MVDTNALERQLADESLRIVGPARPVDDLALFEAVIAANRQKGWGFTMLSALKLVTAGVIVALFGGFLLAGVLTAPQEEGTVPAAVTESPPPVSLEAAAFEGTMPYPNRYQEAAHETISEARVWTTRGLGFQARIEEISDSRLAGTYRNIINNNRYMEDEPSAYVVASASRIDNAGGSWHGHFTGYKNPDDHHWHHEGVMTGSGGYEGLTAVVFLEDTGADSYRVHGMIFPGELPEVPEYPEPAS